MNKKRKKRKRNPNYILFRRNIFHNLNILPKHLFQAKYSNAKYIKKELLTDIFNKIVPGYKYVFENLFPNTIDEIGKTDHYIPFATNSDIRAELEWIQLIISLLCNEINIFIQQKSNYEKYFLLGNFRKAKETINQINSEVAYSFWSYEQISLISEIEGGFVENKKILSNTSDISKNYLSLLFCKLYSYKVELDSTYINFKHSINTQVDSTRDNFLKDYIEYKFSVLDYNGTEENLKQVLCLESLTSVIDLYETFISVCMYIITSNNFSNNIELKKEIFQLLTPLNNVIDDIRIKNILTYNNISNVSNSKLSTHHSESVVFSKLLDRYTLGNYKECKEYFILHYDILCFHFDALEIFVKTLIFMNENLDEYLNEYDLIKTRILKPIYNICICKDKLKNLELLTNTLKIFSSNFYIGKLKWFYHYHKTSMVIMQNDENNKIAILNSKIENPTNIFYFNNINEQIKYLDKINVNGKFSNSNDLYKVYLNIENVSKSILNIPKLRYDYYSTLAIVKKDVNKGILLFEKMLTQTLKLLPINLSYYHYEKVASNLFNLYIKQNKYVCALNLIIDSYFINKSLILRMEKKVLYEYFIEDQETNLYSNIKSIIFFYIIDNSDYSQMYIPLANFLDIQEMILPTDLISNKTLYNDYPKEIIFILSKIYTREMMKRFVRINPKNRIKERIKTLKYLLLLRRSLPYCSKNILLS